MTIELDVLKARVDRAPLCIVFVLDRSSSMQGEPIRHVTSAVSGIVEGLAPNDRAGVVVFDRQAHLLRRVERLSDAHRETLLARLDSLPTGRGTNIEEGLNLAFESMPERQIHEKQIVVLLTDGLPSYGATDAASLAKIAAQASETVKTSVLGFGRHFSSRIVRGVARAGDGAVRHVDSPIRATSIFAETIGQQALVVAEEIELTVEPASGFSVEVIANDLRETAANEAVVRLPSMIGHEIASLGLRLAWGESIEPGFHPVADVELNYVDVPGECRVTKTATLHLDIVEGARSKKCDERAFIAYLDALRNSVVYQSSQYEAVGDRSTALFLVSIALKNLMKMRDNAEIIPEPWLETHGEILRIGELLASGQDEEIDEWVTGAVDREETVSSRLIDRSELAVASRESIIGSLEEIADRYEDDENSD